MSHILILVADRTSASLTQAQIDLARELLSGGPATVLADGEAAEFAVAGPPDLDLLRSALGDAAIDTIAVKPRGRRKALLIADMDSTIITGETLDELADFAGIKDRIAAITVRAMNGELDFKDALRERVAILQGLPLAALEATWERVRLTEGAQELVATMRTRGALTALVSGGFTFFTQRVADRLGFALHRANVLLDDGAVLLGQVAEPILDREAKLLALNELAAERGIKLSATLAVGDGANDLDMLRHAGLGVAFHAKPIVAAEARARVDHGNLRALLFAQGYRAADFVTE